MASTILWTIWEFAQGGLKGLFLPCKLWKEELWKEFGKLSTVNYLRCIYSLTLWQMYCRKELKMSKNGLCCGVFFSLGFAPTYWIQFLTVITLTVKNRWKREGVGTGAKYSRVCSYFFLHLIYLEIRNLKSIYCYEIYCWIHCYNILLCVTACELRYSSTFHISVPVSRQS